MFNANKKKSDNGFRPGTKLSNKKHLEIYFILSPSRLPIFSWYKALYKKHLDSLSYFHHLDLFILDILCMLYDYCDVEYTHP